MSGRQVVVREGFSRRRGKEGDEESFKWLLLLGGGGGFCG